MKRLFAATFLAASLSATVATAGPWTKGPGQLYVKWAESVFLSDRAIGSNGLVTPQDYVGVTSSLYFEAGLPRGLQLQGYLPHLIGKNHNTGEVYAGAADLILALQYAPPLHLPFRLATRIELKLPLYDAGATRDPALGDGNVDLTLWLVAGDSLPRLPLFLWAELGYRHRSELYLGHGPYDDRSFKESVVWFGQLGWKVWRGIVFAVGCSGAQALAADLFTRSVVALGPSLYLPLFHGLALESNLDAIAHAKNAANGLSFGIGLSYQH